MAEADVPMGFRFLPTDDELLHYLREFVSGRPLPCEGVIRARDLYADDPWVVCGNTSDARYFFTPLKTANERGTRFYRTIGGGKATWSGVKSVEIVNEKNRVTGYVKDLKYQAKGSEEDGMWLMREYSLAPDFKKDVKDEFRHHVLCRVKRTPRIRKNLSSASSVEKHEYDPLDLKL